MVHRNESFGIQKRLKPITVIGDCVRHKDFIARRCRIQWQGRGAILSIITINDTALAEWLNLDVFTAELFIIAEIAYGTALVGRHIRNDAAQVKINAMDKAIRVGITTMNRVTIVKVVTMNNATKVKETRVNDATKVKTERKRSRKSKN